MSTLATRAPFSISVKDFVEFLLRTGDLSAGTFGGLYRAREGIEGHRRIRRTRPEGYRAEVPVQRCFSEGGSAWELAGRIDGLLEQPEGLLLEEIKTTREPFDLLSADDPLHWAQAKIYAHLLALDRGVEKLVVQLTYLHLPSEEIRTSRATFTAQELAAFFAPLQERFSAWISKIARCRASRDASLAALDFPFPAWRPGQRGLAGATTDAIRAGGHLFAEAPTGVGKTVSVLWPTLLALGSGACDSIAFLTARTTGRAIAEDTIARMRDRGLCLKALTLTARDRICFADGERCDPTSCAYALGYYDRLPAARDDALASDDWCRDNIEALGRRHNICPFALSLDLLPWADLAICDYNYVFDPRVNLAALAGTGTPRRVLLVDEAHNLPDRARDMYSAEIRDPEFAALIAHLPPDARALRTAASAARRALAEASREGTPQPRDAVPDGLVASLENFVDRANARLMENRPDPSRETLMLACLSAFDFLRTATRFGPDYAALGARETTGPRFRLLCLDPAPRLREITSRFKAAIFFSATLTPPDFFREALGGTPDDTVLRLPSPFPQENLGLIVATHVSTEYRDRAASAAPIADLLAGAALARPGTHVAYFPSYEFLRKVREIFLAAHPAIPAPAQQPAMDDAAKAGFLQLLRTPTLQAPTVAFAVLGGIFAEGIDLPPGSIAGICIVGVGLPQLSLERDLIRKRYDATSHDGFAAAYAFPGFNRVLQAAGRLIRSETDAGTVLLIDRRFARDDYRALFPAHWSHAQPISSLEGLREAVAAFPGPAARRWLENTT